MASRFAPAIDAVDHAIRHSTQFREWLRSRRWCGESVGLRSEMAVKDRAPLEESNTEAIVFFLAVVRHPEGQSVVHLPLSISEGRLERDAFEVPVGGGRVFVSEAEPRDAYVRFVADALEHQAKVPTMAGDVLRFRGKPSGRFADWAPRSRGIPRTSSSGSPRPAGRSCSRATSSRTSGTGSRRSLSGCTGSSSGTRRGTSGRSRWDRDPPASWSPSRRSSWGPWTSSRG